MRKLIRNKSRSHNYLFNTLIASRISYLQKLYEHSKQAKTPFFRIDSHHIRIIQDPLDFYISLKKGIEHSSYRIGLTCLYLGTGSLERYLLRQIKKKKEVIKDIDVTMVFDYNRSLRQEKGESSVQMLYNWKQSLGSGNVKIAFNRNSYSNGVLGQVLGVHHQKIAIFDNKVIIGGANMSQSYFLNRKDRYLQFSQCDQMSNYLNQYLKTLAQNSYDLYTPNKLKKYKDNLKQHIKLWQISYRPKQYQQTIGQQEEYLNTIQNQIQIEQSRNIQPNQVKRKEIQLVSRNQQIAKEIGTSIKIRDQIDEIQYKHRVETVRQNLFGVGRQQFVGNELELVQNSHFKGNDIAQRGEKVYVFPFMHFPKLNMTSQPQLFKQILQIANLNTHDINISSGYLNMSQSILKVLSKQTNEKEKKSEDKMLDNNKVQILCSAPQANSFYEGGRFKKYIPYFYRCFEIDLLKRFSKSNKISILQFNKNDEWSFHSKGVWIKQSQNGYLTIVGSSNYNGRSEQSDIQLQFYLYSTCTKFNKRLDKQYQNMKEFCQKVDLNQLQNDKQIKCTSWIKILSKIFKRFL